MNCFFRFENATARACAVIAAFMILVAAQTVNAANLHIAGVTIVGNTLIVNGSGFDNGAAPFVALGGKRAPILAASSTQIKASIQQFSIGAYRMRVSTGAQPYQNAYFDLNIGAVGPVGPAGPAGPKGDRGPPGTVDTSQYYSKSEVDVLLGALRAELNPTVAVSAGFAHTCAVKLDGRVGCWGANNYGQTSSPPGQFAQVVAGHDGNTCGIRTDGSLSCWGYFNPNANSSLPGGTLISQVSLGYGHGCIVWTTGDIGCWGDNQFGQSASPARRFSQVAAGKMHTCGLAVGGGVDCWGNRTRHGAMRRAGKPRSERVDVRARTRRPSVFGGCRASDR